MSDADNSDKDSSDTEGTEKYDKKDAASDTDSSTSQVSEAWHQARDDSGVRQGDDKQHFESPPDWANKETESGVPIFPERTQSDTEKDKK